MKKTPARRTLSPKEEAAEITKGERAGTSGGREGTDPG